MNTNTVTLKADTVAGTQTDFAWMYDTFMEQFEPDLMSVNIGTLDAKYKDETPELRVARLLRYKAAFELMNECMDEVLNDVELSSALEYEEQVKGSQKDDEKKINAIEFELSTTDNKA